MRNLLQKNNYFFSRYTIQFVHINPLNPADRSNDPSIAVRLVGAGPSSFKISENSNTATITSSDFEVIVPSKSLKKKLFDDIFNLLEKGKEIIVSFGTHADSRINYLAGELASFDTVKYFENEYGIEVEVKKNNEKRLSHLVTLKKIGYSKDHVDVLDKKVDTAPEPELDEITYNPTEDFDPDDTSGGLLDADDEDNQKPGFLPTDWDQSNTNSYNSAAKKRPSFFEEHYLGSDETANFNKVNIMLYAADFVLDNTLNALLTQIVKHKRVINIPQDTSEQKYDPKGLFLYLNKKTNEIHIILNSRKNADDEALQSAVLSPIIVHFLKNGYTVALNYGFEDTGVLNYEVETGKFFNLIDSKYNVETGSNTTSKVQEKQEGDTIFTFVVIKAQK